MSKKILCLGTNDEDTDIQVTKLANENNLSNLGLINSTNFTPVEFGYYHTTVVDLPVGDIVILAKQFDQVILLDQPIEQWPNEKLLFTTIKLFNDLSEIGVSTVYTENQNTQRFLTFDKILKENKSFCIYPWINFNEESSIKLCARAQSELAPTGSGMQDWKSNPQRLEVRKKMLAGEKNPEYCQLCYNYEDKGIESYRQFETQEWVNQLKINSLNDLEKLTQPYYYELRLSNKCNLMCRGCNPYHSHLIEKESKVFNIKNGTDKIANNKTYSSIDRIDIASLDRVSRVYLTGGDPTVIPEVFTFMEKCINAGKTDFQFTLGINAQKISDRFLNLCNHFSSLNFSVSIDGFGKVNDYWRWGSDFDTVIKNTKLLQSHGHNISINTVPGIYNVTNLHLLYEFLDREFPTSTIYLQLNHVPSQNAYNHPNTELALSSLEKCRQTKVYYSNGKSNKTGIDAMYEHYKSNPKCNTELLKRFFDHNDQLDRARAVV